VAATYPPARRATAYDVPELVRLRGVMLASMGVDLESDPTWRERCAAALAEQLTGERFAAYVVEAPDGGLASCGVGWAEARLPSPGHDGLVGHVGNMATDPAHRRRGLARAVLDALQGWFATQGVHRVELAATEEGRGVYEAAGFREPAWPQLRWYPPRP
jgi:GNAT superfamily N-acetyltransferase